MDSSLCEQLPSTRSLKSLVCDVKYSYGNYLIHKFVLYNSERRKDCSESGIRAVLRSFPVDRVNSRNEEGFTALHLAVKKRNSFMVKMLLSCLPTIDVNAQCVKRNGGTALHLAAAGNDFDSADLNLKNITLDKAVKEECLEIFKSLIEYGAFTYIKNDFGQTPLHVAAKRNKIDLIKVLISNGAELNIEDMFGHTPLHHAIYGSGLETVKLLVESGADINAMCKKGITPFYLAVSGRKSDAIKYLISKNVDVADDRNILLSIAILTGSLEAVNYLVKNGALLDYKYFPGKTPLIYAAERNQIDMMKIFISEGADLNAKDYEGRSALHAAINKSGLETVKLLVESGADVNLKDHHGCTPLHDSVNTCGDRSDIVKYLISKNANLNTADKYGATPLHSAVNTCHGLENKIIYLVKNGAHLNVKDERGQTPLHIAARSNKADVVKFLISSGANVNARDKWGRTPLLEVFSNDCVILHRDRCFRTVEALVKSGAVVEAKNQEGETALSMAEERNYIKIVEFLKGRVAADAVDSGDKTSLPEAASSTVSGQPPFKKRRISETCVSL